MQHISLLKLLNDLALLPFLVKHRLVEVGIKIIPFRFNSLQPLTF